MCRIGDLADHHDDDDEDDQEEHGTNHDSSNDAGMHALILGTKQTQTIKTGCTTIFFQL